MAGKWQKGRDKMLWVFRAGRAYFWLEESRETSWRSEYLMWASKDGETSAGRDWGC